MENTDSAETAITVEKDVCVSDAFVRNHRSSEAHIILVSGASTSK